MPVKSLVWIILTRMIKLAFIANFTLQKAFMTNLMGKIVDF